MRSFLPRSVRLAALPGILWLMYGSASVRAQESQSFPINEENGSMVEVTHVFSAVPPAGYTAVRVTVINKGKEEIRLQTGTESTTPASRNEHSMKGPPGDFPCPPESTTTRELIIPLMTDFSTGRSYQGNSLVVNLTVAGRPHRAVFSSSRDDAMPTWGVSQSIGGVSATALNEAAYGVRGKSSPRFRGGDRFAASFLPAQLPTDWRAYTGLDGLALTDSEWDTLPPGVRTAIRHWIMAGGALHLYHQGPAPANILSELKTDTKLNVISTLGSGFVRLVEWDGIVLGPADMVLDQLRANYGPRHVEAREALRSAGYAKINGGGLPGALGVRSFAAWQVGVILLIFGILVGPVNLFYLAAPGKRHRLFITTPLIALGASLVLIIVIFLQDGAGGTGRRAALIEILPDENLSVVHQYQISRTGVLFGGGFVLDAPAVVTPLLPEPSRWTRLKPVDSREAEAQQFNLPEPQAYAGDWFQSRSEQGQLVECVRPGRGRVELKPGSSPPILTSSLAGALEQVFYQDAAGEWWTGKAALETGGSLTLEPATEALFVAWFTDQKSFFPRAARDHLSRRQHAGRFYAKSSDARVGLMDTLTSIAWQNDYVLVHGRLAPDP